MPKPLINMDQNRDQTPNLSLNSNNRVGTNVDPVMLEKRLRNKRSGAYTQAVKQLDVSGTTNQKGFDNFVDAVRNEFPDVPVDLQPIGLVAKCYLGNPYEVHTLDLIGEIVRHYKISEGLPPLMEKARSLAIHGGYEFIEVYLDSLRAVRADGSISVIK